MLDPVFVGCHESAVKNHLRTHDNREFVITVAIVTLYYAIG